MSATAELASFAIETPASALGDDVVAAARRAVLDTIGVSLAGMCEPASRIAIEQATKRSNSTESVIWGTPHRAGAHCAAFSNGIASHVLDFDDTSDAMRGHPSVAVLPAAYAMAERASVSSRDLLAAFVIGVESACKLGLFTGQQPYDHGWHVTATHGVIGATVAVGRIAGLSVKQLQHAIGIAVSSAAGVRGNFGSMTKSLHIGRLAETAITAVELADREFTASPEAIEGTFGYWSVFGRDPKFANESLGSYLGNPFEIVSPGFNVKAYPCCASAHAAIDAALEARKGMSPDAIEHVLVSVPYTAPLLLIHHRPTNALEAKFSLEFCVAAALLDGAVTLDHFTDTTVQRPDLQDLLRRVTYAIPEEWAHDDGTARTGFARIDVHLTNGSIRHAETTEARGSPGRPLSDQELEAKFTACAGFVFGAGQIQELLDALQQVDRLSSIRQLSALLSNQPVLRHSI